jgi:hypothetical protein
MYLRRISFVGAIALLLLTCTSCQVEALDADGDGFISKSELLTAAFDAVCGDQGGDETPDGESPDGETPDGQSPDGETPDGEAPTGETPDGETPIDEIPNGTTDSE